MKALITGATGFIGSNLVHRLEKPNVMSRNVLATEQKFGEHIGCAYEWEPASSEPCLEAFDGVDTVFHLAGEPVAKGRWTPEKKRKIIDSRVLGTKNLVTALAKLEHKPKTLVAASAVGFYGTRGDEILTEGSKKGRSFLANLCLDWESEINRASRLGIRVVIIRIGIVLGKEGGALSRMLPTFKLGLGGVLGKGTQWMPWIHEADLVSLFLFAAEHDTISGPLNGTAPSPCTNREFTKHLAIALKRPAFLVVPTFALEFMLGEFASVLLASQRVVPEKVINHGFSFHYATIDEALTAILR